MPKAGCTVGVRRRSAISVQGVTGSAESSVDPASDRGRDTPGQVGSSRSPGRVAAARPGSARGGGEGAGSTTRRVLRRLSHQRLRPRRLEHGGGPRCRRRGPPTASTRSRSSCQAGSAAHPRQPGAAPRRGIRRRRLLARVPTSVFWATSRSRLGCAASMCVRWTHPAARTGRPRLARGSGSARRWPSSSTAPAPWMRISRSRSRTARRSPRSADGSTASRSRSSWRPLTPGSWRRTRCCDGSTAGCPS